jgi:EmrB/QacA subfamily drug resistance transporter
MSEAPTVTSDEATSPPSASPPASLSAGRMWAILVVVLIADALDLLDATITNIAAPTIVGDIGGGPALIKWLGSAYALALGTLLVVGGRPGDKFGQRTLFLIGMSGFTLASAAAGLSVNPTMMIVARLFQGAFGALLIPQGMAIMTTSFSREMRAKAFGAFGPMLGVAGIGGPVLAGFIINADLGGLSWRPIFLINIILGGIGLIAATRVLPHDDGDRATRVDTTGSMLLAVAMFGLLFGLIEGSTNGWTIGPLACIAGGVLAFGLFAWRQSTAPDPLLKPTLFKNRGFTSGLIMGLAFFAAVNGVSYVLSLFLQQGLGYSAGRTSIALLPLTIGIIAASGACMVLIAKLGRTLLFIGLLITLVGTGWMLAVVTVHGTTVGEWAIIGPVFVIGIGMDTCFGIVFDIALGDVDPDEAGSASGALSAVQQLAAGMGSAAVTSVYFSGLASHGVQHAMILSLLVVIGIVALCTAIVPVMPRKAAAGEHP